MRALCAVALLLLAGVARAEPPNGAYAITIDGDGALRVPSGGSAVCRIWRQIEVCTRVHAETNVLGTLMEADPDPASPDGPLGDDGEIELDGPGVTGLLPIDLFDGLISGSNRKPKASLVLVLVDEGQVTENGLTFGASGVSVLRCKPDREQADALECRGRAQFDMTATDGAVVGRPVVPVVTRLELVERPFELELDLETDAKGKITGTANVVFEQGTLPRVVTGKYDARSDTATLKLSSIDATVAGNKLVLKRVRFADQTLHGGKLSYKLARQKGKAVLPE